MICRSFFDSTTGVIATITIAAISAWLLWSHTGHILLAVPYLFLLVCPLMHLIHRGHSHHAATARVGGPVDRQSEPR